MSLTIATLQVTAHPVDTIANDDIARPFPQLFIWIAVIITSATAQRKAASKNPMTTNLFDRRAIRQQTLMDTPSLPGTNEQRLQFTLPHLVRSLTVL